MTRHPLAYALALLFALSLSPNALAQDAPFIGVVTKDKVEVRSGAGRAYYVVGDLRRGDMVRVEKVLFNQTWYQVRVPKDVYSYVSKAFVDAQADGGSGEINADRTEFKAASLRGPGESYRVQGTLSKGDTVKIISEEGNFYKIQSPSEAFVFIPADTLREATAEDLKAAGESEDEPNGEQEAEGEGEGEGEGEPDGEQSDERTGDGSGEQDSETPKPEPKPEPGPADDDKPVQPVPPVEEVPVPDPKPEPDPDPEPEPEPKPDPDPDPKPEPDPKPLVPGITGWPDAPDVEVKTPARSEALKSLETRVLPYFSLPVTEQPLDKMADAYTELQADKDLPRIDQQIIEVRLRGIERRKQIRASIERSRQSGDESSPKTAIPDAPDTDNRPRQYAAVGILRTSAVYDGKTLPRLYRLVDAATSGRTLAYVAPNRKQNLGAMLNQVVGIVGETTYDRTLRLNVIELEKAVRLDAGPEPEPATEGESAGGGGAAESEDAAAGDTDDADAEEAQ